MFDALRNIANLPQLMSKAREMQERMKQMQEELARQTFDFEAAGGMVTATVNGKLELVRIRIDRGKVDFNDLELLEDLICAAVAGAQRRAAEFMQSEMAKLSASMGLPPGALGSMGP